MKIKFLAAILTVFLFTPGLTLADGGMSETTNSMTSPMLSGLDRLIDIGGKYVECVPASVEKLVDDATNIPNVFKDSVDKDGWVIGIFTGGFDVVLDLGLSVVETTTQLVGCGFDKDCV